MRARRSKVGLMNRGDALVDALVAHPKAPLLLTPRLTKGMHCVR